MPTTVTGVAQTTLTDQDLAAKILSEHKCAASSITQAILETADDSLRGEYMGILEKTLNHQKMIFDYMYKKGWYKLTPASPEEISYAKGQGK
ncbi:MAG: spore coat protein [Limnochordia bacterium]|jgi:spore coat protein F